MKSLSNQSYQITKGDIVTNFKSSLSHFKYESETLPSLLDCSCRASTLDIASYLTYNELHDYTMITDKLTLEHLSEANISCYINLW